MALPVSFLLSFLAVRGFRFSVTPNGFSLRNTESFDWLLIFIFFTWALYVIFKEPDKRIKKYAALFSVCVTVFYTVGKSLEERGTLTWIWESKTILLNYLNLFFSHMILYYCAAFLVFRLLRDKSCSKPEQRHTVFSIRKVLFFWALLLIIYIPWYLYCYPGVLTYDSGDQVRDALSVNTLSDFNPAFITLLLRFILIPVQKITGSVQVGIGICSFLQMLIVTFVFALTIERIYSYLQNWCLRIIVLAWYALYPVNNIYSVTMWKDILFSVCMLGFLLCIDSAVSNEKSFFSRKRTQFFLFLTMLLLPLLRHNGISISLIMSLYLLFYFRGHRRQILLICGSSLLLFCIWQFIIIPKIRTSTVPTGDFLSVPLQQITRVLSYHHSEMDPKMRSEAESYFNVQNIWHEYDPQLADPVKRHFNSELFKSDPLKFFSLWMKLGKVYKLEYIEAFLNNNYGYWYPETRYWISSYGVIAGGTIEDVHTAPIVKIGIIDKIYNWYAYHKYMSTPLIPLLFSRGACFWLWVFCGMFCFYRNRRKFALVLPGYILWFFILWSAVYNEYRYVYGLFICIPLVLSSVLSTGNNRKIT